MRDIIKNLESKENITNNDWRTVELEIKYLYEQIKSIVVGETSFENILGDPEDNAALKAVLDGKASEIDLETLQGVVNSLQTALENVYTKTETDALLDEKADKTDTYTKTEVDTLLDDKADQDDLDNLNDTVSDIQSDLEDKVDKVNGYMLMPNDLPSRVTQNEADIQDLKDYKQDKMQFTELPNAQDYLGKIVQYIGPTTPLLTNGYFYQADYNSETLTYEWIEKLSGGGAQYTAGQGIEITDNEIKCTLLNDTITSTTTTWSSQKLRHEFEAIAGATKVFVVAELPTIGELNSIYYQGTEAPYNIYLYTSNNEWVFIGTTGVNLQDYYTKTEIDAKETVINNKILDITPQDGKGIVITNLPNHLGKSIAAKGTSPIDVDVNDGIKLKYNEGLDVNTNGELKVNIGNGLKLNGSNNTIEPDVDNTSVILDANDKISVPLKTVNNNSLYGTGNINISPTPTLIGQLQINTQSGQTTCTLTENINNYNQIFIKVASNYADMGSLVLLKPSGTNGWIQGATHWYTYQNSLLLIGQSSIYGYYGNFYCVSRTQLNFTEIHSVIMNYSTGAITYSSPVGFTVYIYGI